MSSWVVGLSLSVGYTIPHNVRGVNKEMQNNQKNICPLKRRVKLGICKIDQPCNGTLVEYGSGPDLVLRCVECGAQQTQDSKEDSELWR